MTQSSSVSITQSILPIRFTVKEHAFEHTGAHILAVNWMNDARKVLDMLATQNKTKSGKVYLPTVSLDTALSTINPVVAHGYRAMDDRHHFTLIVNKDELPNPSLIATLGSKWAEVWSERHFPDRLAHPEFRNLHQRIATVVDWQEISAHAALYDAANEKLRYSVIPSVLSALFAAGGPSQLGGQNVTWGLSQQSECNGWQVVSSPLLASNGSTFAYLIRFSVQYQPGISDPRIHAAIICQRYADRPVKDSGGRNISFLCRLGQPLMAQEGSWNDNLIRLVASTNAIDGMSFGPGLPEILRRAQARVLASPADILADPQCFRGEQPGSDRYLVVHFEGLETELDSDEDDEEAAQTSGKHGIGTGFSLTERWEIYQTIAERLAQFL